MGTLARSSAALFALGLAAGCASLFDAPPAVVAGCDESRCAAEGGVCARGACVECATDDVCASKHGPGSYCGRGSCKVVVECSVDLDCGADFACAYPRCKALPKPPRQPPAPPPPAPKVAKAPRGKRAKAPAAEQAPAPVAVAEPLPPQLCGLDADCGEDAYCEQNLCKGGARPLAKIALASRPTATIPIGEAEAGEPAPLTIADARALPADGATTAEAVSEPVAPTPVLANAPEPVPTPSAAAQPASESEPESEATRPSGPLVASGPAPKAVAASGSAPAPMPASGPAPRPLARAPAAAEAPEPAPAPLVVGVDAKPTRAPGPAPVALAALTSPPTSVEEPPPASTPPSAPEPLLETPTPAAAPAPEPASPMSATCSADDLSRVRIMFAPGSANLRRDAAAAVKQLAPCMQGTILVVGHADKVGREERNQRLSVVRAEAVARLLEEARVPRARIEVEGKGELEPLCHGDSEPCYAQNRRVELHIAP